MSRNIFILFSLSICPLYYGFSFGPIYDYFKDDKESFSTCTCYDPGNTIPGKNNLLGAPKNYALNIFSKMGFPSCALTKNSAKSVEKALRNIVEGQDKSIGAIVNQLSAHLNNKNSLLTQSPLVLHFAGDFGVGKTLAASVISSFLFQRHRGRDPVDHEATLLFSGSKYLPQTGPITAESREKQAQMVSLIRRKILRQLSKCPNSLIILNDLQKMDSEIFSRLEDFFEGVAYTQKKKPVVSKRAIFVFTSDLGSADFSRGWSYRKLEAEIKKRFGLYTNFNKKLESLVVHVPFQTLGKQDMRKIFRNELKTSLSCSSRFDCVKFDAETVEMLVSRWESSKLIQKMNGRAFHKYIYPVYVENAIQRVMMLPKKAGYWRCLTLRVDVKNDGTEEDKRVVASLELRRKEKRANKTEF